MGKSRITAVVLKLLLLEKKLKQARIVFMHDEQRKSDMPMIEKIMATESSSIIIDYVVVGEQN